MSERTEKVCGYIPKELKDKINIVRKARGMVPTESDIIFEALLLWDEAKK